MSLRTLPHRLGRAAFLTGWGRLAELAIAEHLLEDGAAVIAGLRALQPESPELCLLEGRLAAKRGDYREAIRWLQDLESSPTHWSAAKTLIASCQYLAGDADWEASIHEVLTRPGASPEARRFAQCLLDAELPMAKPEHDDRGATAAAAVSLPQGLDIGYGVFMRA